jgi:acyl transferase domain-containing protein/3-hydroxymyristoyl/3-hydroxydecanoyl-(acyl carrier protein) dehydratase/NAD(P)-dependent dehydrogenase (short-subunit alcohol dehydrogenase family)/acyl carrier protein
MVKIKKNNTNETAVAIIGMGCIFPKSSNLKEYWHLLFNGIDAIENIPDDTHWKLKDYFSQDPATPDHTYCTRGGFIPAIAFDPLSYGIPPNNIAATDTSQLLGLEVARMALEDAGYPVNHPFLQDKTVNVILGVTGTQELVIPLGARLGHPIWKKALDESGIGSEKKEEILHRIQSAYVPWQENSFPGLLGNVVAGRIANRLNLSGTNTVSDSACASSLSAMHTAVMELQSHRCDMSITGGVDTLNDIFMHMCFSKTGVLSSTSDIKPFSKDADGTLLGEGIGMIVLKRLEDAKRDNDRIYALIKGMGTSSDGKTSAIYAPETKGQIKALNQAYALADIHPSTVELIEAHGTGTRVGDKVEFTALKSCFTQGPMACQNITAIGSVKSMIGHTKAAAGAAGIIKTALALYNKVIPPTLKAGTPDPELAINESAFYLNDQSKPWMIKQDNSHPRRAGISAFGFGGSNFHAVLEEYDPKKSHVSWDGSIQILAFSANTKKELTKKINTLEKQVADSDSNSGEKSLSIAWQAFESRQSFCSDDEFRLLIVLNKQDNLPEMIKKALATLSNGEVSQGSVFFASGKPEGKLGFLFPGQGSQYTQMAKTLSSVFPEAMDAISSAQSCFQKENPDIQNNSLAGYIFPVPLHLQTKTQSEDALRQTDIAQPALGAICLGMTQILSRFKVTPAMACGHSFGELSALYAAGWIDKECFFQLAAARGKYMAAAGKKEGDSGSMLAIQAPIKEIEELIKAENLDLVLANKNSHAQGVLSGHTHEIDKAKTLCKQKKMRAIKLPVAAAFHSRLVEEAATPFKTFVASKQIAPTDIDVLSNTTGSPYPCEPDQIKQTLGNQLMHPVNFIDNIEQMHKAGVSTFIEIGPKAVLTGLVKSILNDKKITALSLDASAGKKSGLQDLAQVLCAIAANGFFVDLTQWEEKVEQPRSKKMKVMLSGANPKPVIKSTPIVKTTPILKSDNSSPKRSEKTEPSMENQTLPEIKRQVFQGSNMKTPDAFQQNHPSQVAPSPSSESLYLIQKGFEAMQQLQSQTARAHEKFLETQAQASKTLAGMMEQTRGFVGPTSSETGAAPVAAPVSMPEVLPITTAAPFQAPSVRSLGQTESPPVETPVIAQTQSLPVQPLPAQTSPILSLSIRQILFEIVARLTGFPVEMLEPDMEIESDLGIDSIKKVEIISELERQIPEGNGLSTDHMGSVKTLEDICRAIEPGKPQDEIFVPVETVTDSSDFHDSNSNDALSPDALGTSGKIFAVLVDAISELTGFPVEMLEPHMNLESDLGIDSIKRVEILSRLEQELEGVTLSSEDMAGLQNIQDIVQFLTPDNPDISTISDADSDTENNNKKKTSITAGDENLAGIPAESVHNPIVRQEIIIKEFPTNQIRFYNGAKIELSRQKKVYLTRDNSGIAAHFKKEFEKQGILAALIDLSHDKIPDLSDAAGIVIIPDSFKHGDSQTAKKFLKSAFCLAQKNAPHLISSGTEKGAFFTTLSFMGGGFGFIRPSFSASPVYGGLAGLAKTAALEWKNVLCRALDMPDSIEKCVDNSEAAVSLMMTQGAVEMGLDADSCNIPTLENKEISQETIDLGPDDVVVITGGAKGVTAECAVQLAKAHSPKIILLGRSPEPFMEPAWIQGITDPAKMKKQILSHQFAGQKVKPADIETRYQAIVSNRAIQANIDRVRAYGSFVKYFSADIRDPQEIERVFKSVQQEFSQISAIIHGAGVLEDKLICDKRLDQFNRVFDTKVEGLETLLNATEQDPLKYVVLFSSIAARTGNTGQCDYAMANEVLNKTAQKLSLSRPDCRFLSMNWGPWAGGMVDEGLKREFSKKGIELIPLEQGALQLLKEMGNPDRKPVEIVIGAHIPQNPPPIKPVLKTVLTQSFGRKASPILESHKIAQEPVVPFALLIELLAHAAEKNNPGLVFAGMDDMRLLKGIRTQNDDIQVLVNLGKCQPFESGFTTQGNIGSMNTDIGVTHAAGTIRLKNNLPQPPVLSKAAFMDLKPSTISIENIYDDILFHGKSLQCITAINGVSAKGIEVTTTLAPRPEEWFLQPHGNDWTIDPLMLDAAFQAAILWTFETKQQVCLPSYLANLRLYASHKKLQGKVRILFTVNEETPHKIKGYFTFLDTQTVVASITGFEAIVDPSLRTKFKNYPLFSREKILAFAQGNPSEAFGEKYKIFDRDRQIARLPRPPYFFMDRVVKADHPQWKMQPGGWVEVQYDIPEDAWYFTANRTQTIPFCILLEIALQPCGWLAAYAGSALESSDRLHFRNLGGIATIFKPISNESGTLTIRSRITNVSKAGGMIIQDYEMDVSQNGQPVYQGTTNFGFFTQTSLSNQVGVRDSKFKGPISKTGDPHHIFFDDAPITPGDKQTGKNSGMPSKALRMIDHIEFLDPEAGLYKQGYIKGTKKVDPTEWFFDAHFYQDPVCPGSLGVESFLQLLRFFLLKKYPIQADQYALQMTPDHTHEWIYRGQIIPANKTIEIHAHIRQTSVLAGIYTIIADGCLTVDNICIYEMKNFSMEFVPVNQVIEKYLAKQIPEQK